MPPSILPSPLCHRPPVFVAQIYTEWAASHVAPAVSPIACLPARCCAIAEAGGQAVGTYSALPTHQCNQCIARSVGGRPIRLCLQTGEPLATPCRLGDPWNPSDSWSSSKVSARERPMSSQRSMAPSLGKTVFQVNKGQRPMRVSSRGSHGAFRQRSHVSQPRCLPEADPVTQWPGFQTTSVACQHRHVVRENVPGKPLSQVDVGWRARRLNANPHPERMSLQRAQGRSSNRPVARRVASHFASHVVALATALMPVTPVASPSHPPIRVRQVRRCDGRARQQS